MHQYFINASLQLIPIDHASKAMPQIDKAIDIIKASGLPSEVGPFGTTVEGTYQQVTELIDTLNEMMAQNSEAEWVLNIQMHISPSANITMQGKTSKHR
ncbi:MAG TPA: thiamine-binding protein [Phnomibacter sp.]|nr:thiamine-binding protein [Phnomibacter sp.]